MRPPPPRLLVWRWRSASAAWAARAACLKVRERNKESDVMDTYSLANLNNGLRTLVTLLGVPTSGTEINDVLEER